MRMHRPYHKPPILVPDDFLLIMTINVFENAIYVWKATEISPIFSVAAMCCRPIYLFQKHYIESRIASAVPNLMFSVFYHLSSLSCPVIIVFRICKDRRRSFLLYQAMINSTAQLDFAASEVRSHHVAPNRRSCTGSRYRSGSSSSRPTWSSWSTD